MSPNPMGWRPPYAAQFQQARKRRVSKVQQTKVVKAILKRMGW